MHSHTAALFFSEDKSACSWASPCSNLSRFLIASKPTMTAAQPCRVPMVHAQVRCKPQCVTARAKSSTCHTTVSMKRSDHQKDVTKASLAQRLSTRVHMPKVSMVEWPNKDVIQPQQKEGSHTLYKSRFSPLQLSLCPLCRIGHGIFINIPSDGRM